MTTTPPLGSDDSVPVASPDVQVQLPPQLRWANYVRPEEVVDLRASNFGTSTQHDSPPVEYWRDVIENPATICVAIYHGRLLVSVGFVSGSGRHAVLCEEATRPEYQGKGLEIAVLFERVRLCLDGDNWIQFLYTHLAQRDGADYFEAIEALDFKGDSEGARNFFLNLDRASFRALLSQFSD